MPGRFSSGAGRVAVGGILAAGSLAVLWLASVTPTGQLGVTAVAGLFPVGAVLAAGRTAGYLCWAAASILGLLLLPDKGAALMYLCFLGLYPVVKSRLESLKSWYSSGGCSCPRCPGGWGRRSGCCMRRGTGCSWCMISPCPA